MPGNMHSEDDKGACTNRVNRSTQNRVPNHTLGYGPQLTNPQEVP